MILIGQTAAFALGIYLSIRVIAALYGVIDLWHQVRTAYPRVMRSVVGWSTATLTVAWLLERTYRLPFECGLGAFPLFYLSLYPLRHLLLFALRRRA